MRLVPSHPYASSLVTARFSGCGRLSTLSKVEASVKFSRVINARTNCFLECYSFIELIYRWAFTGQFSRVDRAGALVFLEAPLMGQVEQKLLAENYGGQEF